MLTASAAAAALGGSEVMHWVIESVTPRGAPSPKAVLPARAKAPSSARPRPVSLRAPAHTPSQPWPATPPSQNPVLAQPLAAQSTASAEAQPAKIQAQAVQRSAPRNSHARPDAERVSDDASLQLLTQAQAAREQRQPERALALYRLLAQRYPDSRAARGSRISLARLMQSDDPRAALQIYEDYMRMERSGALAEEARLGRAQCLDALGLRGQALEAWRSFSATYPSSIHSQLARERVSELEH